MPGVSLLLLSLVAAEPPPSRACPAELFRIERSKNANVVLYEARPGRAGRLDPEEPVQVSWLMLAEGGARERLTFAERAFAYGVEVKAARAGPRYTLRLRALEGRSLEVVEAEACPMVLASIGGQEGVLQRIFVKTDERGLVPRVEYVELFGVAPGSGAALYEKLLPGQG